MPPEPQAPLAVLSLMPLNMILLALLLAGPGDPPVAAIKGELFTTVVDTETGRIAVELKGGERIAEFPVGLGVRPSPAPRLFKTIEAGGSRLIRGDSADDEPGDVLAALLDLKASGIDAPVTLAVRSGPYGPVLIYGIPAPALAGLAPPSGNGAPPNGSYRIGHSLQGLPFRMGGRPLPRDGICLSVPGRVLLRLRNEPEGDPVRSLRLRGSLALGDESPEEFEATLEVRCGGVSIYRSPPVRRGADPIQLDVPLADAGDLELVASGAPEGAPGSAALGLRGFSLHGANRSVESVAERLLLSEPGLDLLAGGSGEASLLHGLEVLPPEPGPGRDGVAVVDLGNCGELSFRPAPLLLPLTTPSGWLMGIGLAYVPDASRFGLELDRVTLNLPSASIRLAEDEQARLVLAIVLGRTREELAERYLETLANTGSAATGGGLAGLKAPRWWSRPLLLAQPPAGGGRFSPYDTVEVAQRARELEQRFGVDRFTLVLDGPWSERPGDPAPSESFERLRTLIAAEHVKGRKVLLRWDPCAAGPGSLADIVGVVVGGRIDATLGKKYRAYVHEVVRACISDQFHSLNADGLLFRGDHLVRSPDGRAPGPGRDEGIGFRELGTVLETYSLELQQVDPEALLLTAAAVPQFATSPDGILLPVSGSTPADREAWDARAALLAALMPELPIYCGPGDGTFAEKLSWAVRSAVIGVPAVHSVDLKTFDEGQARTLGAVLRLAAERQLGRPERLPDGRIRTVIDGRVLAETLEEESGLVVYPVREEAALVLVREVTEISLPFVPSRQQGNEPVEIVATGERTVLRGARVGVIYRFSL
ncbi:MAG: hypothetical protein V2A76_15110 [Planctomycetota bacterium]